MQVLLYYCAQLLTQGRHCGFDTWVCFWSQAQGMGGVPLKYNGMFDVIKKTVELEGIQGMYKGLTPNLMKIAPAAGISWFVFEESKRILQA